MSQISRTVCAYSCSALKLSTLPILSSYNSVSYKYNLSNDEGGVFMLLFMLSLHGSFFFLCLHFIKVVMYVYTIMTHFKHILHNCLFCVSVWIKLFRSVY